VPSSWAGCHLSLQQVGAGLELLGSRLWSLGHDCSQRQCGTGLEPLGQGTGGQQVGTGLELPVKCSSHQDCGTGLELMPRCWRVPATSDANVCLEDVLVARRCCWQWRQLEHYSHAELLDFWLLVLAESWSRCQKLRGTGLKVLKALAKPVQ